MRPLADQLRPRTFEEVIGQEPLCGAEGVLRRLATLGHPLSLVLWGEAGTGKTTIARLLAEAWDATWEPLSAINASTADLRKRFEELRRHRRVKPPVFFIDEIHHFNRAQQDIFLPYVEEGTIVLIGATTQNPSFALNPALLSRLRTYTLSPLTPAHLNVLLSRAKSQLHRSATWLSEEVETALCHYAAGDGRALLGMVETLATSTTLPEPVTIEAAQQILGQSVKGFERQGEQHYNLISVLHKAIRGSDVDAALYWLARMLVQGEDPQYIFRRLLRCASEDIGLAEPLAISQVVTAWQGFERLGQPEGEILLAQAVLFLAAAPKSNAVYRAEKKAKALAAQSIHAPPPPYGLNAPTALMRELGYSEGYVYDHDTPEGFSGLNYFPRHLPRTSLYVPTHRGFEREIEKRLAYWEGLREKKESS